MFLRSTSPEEPKQKKSFSLFGYFVAYFSHILPIVDARLPATRIKVASSLALEAELDICSNVCLIDREEHHLCS